MLKVREGEVEDEKVMSLSSDLELANSRINELETDNRWVWGIGKDLMRYLKVQ